VDQVAQGLFHDPMMVVEPVPFGGSSFQQYSGPYIIKQNINRKLGTYLMDAF
jgi:hypothetical protein